MMMEILKILNNVSPSDTTRKGVPVEHYEDKKRSLIEMLKSPMTLSQGAAIMNEWLAKKEKENGSIHNGIKEECHADHSGRIQRHDEPVVQ